MCYVLRYSPNIQGDLKRNWSAWMGLRSKDLYDLLVQLDGVEAIEEAWEDWSDVDYAPFVERDHDDFDAFLDYLAGENDIRFDPDTKEWCAVHHDGLSCFLLEAEDEEEAIAEGKALASMWPDKGFGYQTEGSIRLVCSLPDDWHILECEDVSLEF